ncbi:MAG: hypothetical protein NT016_03395 [Candidatus Aenigmarchaeota archaeon]|nr:hypothetical protein [Candidatus Aenigmarchaeota archaeon]
MLPERYVPKKIAAIGEADRRVAVVGTLGTVEDDETSERHVIVDDGTGKIEVFFDAGENGALAGAVRSEDGMLVRAFCTNDGGKLRLDVLQPMAGADINLLKTVDELYGKAGL